MSSSPPSSRVQIPPFTSSGRLIKPVQHYGGCVDSDDIEDSYCSPMSHEEEHDGGDGDFTLPGAEMDVVDEEDKTNSQNGENGGDEPKRKKNKIQEAKSKPKKEMKEKDITEKEQPEKKVKNVKNVNTEKKPEQKKKKEKNGTKLGEATATQNSPNGPTSKGTASLRPTAKLEGTGPPTPVRSDGNVDSQREVAFNSTEEEGSIPTTKKKEVKTAAKPKLPPKKVAKPKADGVLITSRHTGPKTFVPPKRTIPLSTSSTKFKATSLKPKTSATSPFLFGSPRYAEGTNKTGVSVLPQENPTATGSSEESSSEENNYDEIDRGTPPPTGVDLKDEFDASQYLPSGVAEHTEEMGVSDKVAGETTVNKSLKSAGSKPSKKKPSPAEKVTPAHRVAVLEALNQPAVYKAADMDKLVASHGGDVTAPKLVRHWREVLFTDLKAFFGGEPAKKSVGKASISPKLRKELWHAIIQTCDKADWSAVAADTGVSAGKLKRHLKESMWKDGAKFIWQ